MMDFANRRVKLSKNSNPTAFLDDPLGVCSVCYAIDGTLLLARNAVLRRERNKFRIQQMEREAERNEEVNQMKFRFFTNVSHELRTPLTLIISPLEGMMKETHDEQARSN